MFEIERPKIECKELNDYYGCFVVEPLERGFGTTLGIFLLSFCSPFVLSF